MIPTKSFVFFKNTEMANAQSLSTSFPYKGDLYLSVRGSATTGNLYVMGKFKGATCQLPVVKLNTTFFPISYTITLTTNPTGEYSIYAVIGAEGFDEIFIRTSPDFNGCATVIGKFMFAG